jgi:hypothetical protein
MRECKNSNNFFENGIFSNSLTCNNFLIENERDISFAHFDLGDGHATVVGAYCDGALYYGVSLCSPEDNFSRSKGRLLAEWHFRNGKQRGVIFGNFDHLSPPLALLNALEYYLSGKRHFPKWAKKNATISLRGEYRGE